MAQLLAGLWLFGTGEAMLVAADIGNGPWVVLAQGVSLHTPLTIGVATQLIGVVVLLGWIPLRERPGLGTLCNVIVIGLAIDVMLLVLPRPEAAGVQVAFVLLGIGLIGLGSGLYLTADLGPGPRDGLMTGLHRRYGWPLSRVRMGIELTVLVAGCCPGRHRRGGDCDVRVAHRPGCGDGGPPAHGTSARRSASRRATGLAVPSRFGLPGGRTIGWRVVVVRYGRRPCRGGCAGAARSVA